MALVVFLRGVNVGGHRTFRPSVLAERLRAFDVVNVGAAGTFVVRKPGSRAKFRDALVRLLPFETEVVLCEGRDLLRIVDDDPFRSVPLRPDVVRFVSVCCKPARPRAPFPIAFPAEGEWLVKILSADGRFVFGAYRRHMKTIGLLGKIDGAVGAPVTTRNWNTVNAVARILRAPAVTAPV